MPFERADFRVFLPKADTEGIFSCFNNAGLAATVGHDKSGDGYEAANFRQAACGKRIAAVHRVDSRERGSSENRGPWTASP
jgi:hypothetical protein